MPLSSPTVFSFDTEAHPEAMRFEIWRDLMSATHEAFLPDENTMPFHASLCLLHFGELLVAHGSCSPQTFIRSRHNIRRDQVDHYTLFAQGRGSRRVRIGEREIHLRAGDVMVGDLAQAMQSFSTSGESATLYLPRDLVNDAIPGIAPSHGSLLRGPAARLLADHLLTLRRHQAEFPEPALVHLANAASELALACLSERVDGPALTHEPIRNALRRQIERYVDANLGNPNLCAASICTEFRIARSTLYDVFTVHGGVAGFIKQRRLLRIRSILIAGTDPRPLADIAEDFGFRTSAHFSREFRAAFGCRPSDLRRMAPEVSHLDHASSSSVSMGRLIHSLPR